jgi:hypothetical protein
MAYTYDHPHFALTVDAVIFYKSDKVRVSFTAVSGLASMSTRVFKKKPRLIFL